MEDREEWVTFTSEGERVDIVYRPPSDTRVIRYSLKVNDEEI